MKSWLVLFAALVCFQFSAFGQELVPDDEPAAPAAPEKGETEKAKAPEQAPAPAAPERDTAAPENVVE
jgi:hypothetical protein